METGLYVCKMNGRGPTLVPASRRTQEELRAARLKDGDLVSVKIVRSRNPKFAALAHVVFARIGEAVGLSASAVETQVKLALGYIDLVERQDGTIEPSPKRLDFDSMPDEDDFKKFWNLALPLICERIVPGLPDSEAEELLAIIEGRRE